MRFLFRKKRRKRKRKIIIDFHFLSVSFMAKILFSGREESTAYIEHMAETGTFST